VAYCHKLNIIHRDIKHQNLLLNKNRCIKLIDFGLSNFRVKGKLGSTFCGTPAYAAPEMLLGNKYEGPEVDIWSLGVVLYRLITNNLPFKNVSDILSGHFTDPDNISEECKNLIKQMLKVDSKKRITISNIMKHPWFVNSEEVKSANALQ